MGTTGYAQRVVARPIKALIVNPDDSYEVRTIKQDIRELQTLVGGHIQAVTTEHAIIWCNEDGQHLDLPRNHLATFFWWQLAPEMEGRDWIVGTVFVTGHADPDGDMLPVNDEVLELYERIDQIHRDEQARRNGEND